MADRAPLPYASRHGRRWRLPPALARRNQRLSAMSKKPLLKRLNLLAALRANLCSSGNARFRIVVARRPVLGLDRTRARGFWARPAPRPVTMAGRLFRGRCAR